MSTIIRRRLISAKENRNANTFAQSPIIVNLPSVGGKRILFSPVKYPEGGYISTLSLPSNSSLTYITNSSSLDSGYQAESINYGKSSIDFQGFGGGTDSFFVLPRSHTTQKSTKLDASFVSREDNNTWGRKFSYLRNRSSTGQINCPMNEACYSYYPRKIGNNFFAAPFVYVTSNGNNRCGVMSGYLSSFTDTSTYRTVMVDYVWDAGVSYTKSISKYPTMDYDQNRMLITCSQYDGSHAGLFIIASADMPTGLVTTHAIDKVDGSTIYKTSQVLQVFKINNKYYLVIRQANKTNWQVISSSTLDSTNWTTCTSEYLPDYTLDYIQLGPNIVGTKVNGNTTTIYASTDLINWVENSFDNNGFNVNNRGLLDWQEDETYYYYVASNVSPTTVSGSSALIKFAKTRSDEINPPAPPLLYTWNRYTVNSSNHWEIGWTGATGSDMIGSFAIDPNSSPSYPIYLTYTLSIDNNGVITGVQTGTTYSDMENGAVYYSYYRNINNFCKYLHWDVGGPWWTWATPVNVTDYSRGDYIDQVQSYNPDLYPDDGKQGDYWYVKQSM